MKAAGPGVGPAAANVVGSTVGGDVNAVENDQITGTINPGESSGPGLNAVGKDIHQTYIAKQEIINPPVDTGQPDVAELRTAYLNHLFDQANHLSLAGVDPKAASSEAHLHLGAVYTALLTKTSDLNEREFLGQRPEREQRVLSAVTQLNQHPRLVLLGDPGGGKSTFVNFVALCLAGEILHHPQANLALLTAPLPDDAEQLRNEREQKAPLPQPWAQGPLLPVRVVLRDFAARGLPEAGAKATADHLWRFICAELTGAALGDYAPYLRRELLNKGGLLLLDGLDEVPDADQRRSQIQQAIEDFVRVFRRCRVLVTSRTYAYQQQEWRLDNFTETVLAPFTDGQIRRFIDRWYAHIAELRRLNPADAQGRAALLQHAIFASDRLHELAERPLLLTLTASLHAWRGGSLPERREELYGAAVDLLLDWWENQRVVRDAQGAIRVIQPSLVEWLKVDRTKVRALLNQLAFHAHASQPALVGTADLAENDLVAGLLDLSQNPDVRPKLLMEYLSQRAGLLVPRGVKVYTFPHRTFQEYLAACYLTDKEYPDMLADLVRGDPIRWREVALLAGAKAASGTASAIWSLVDALCFPKPDAADHTVADTWGAQLAGQALLETADLTQISPRNQAKLALVRRSLGQLLQGDELPAVERALAGRTLAKLGDPRDAVLDPLQMEFCFVPSGPFVMGDGDEQYEHNVTYEYWISRYPVTNAQFDAFVGAGGYANPAFWPEAQAAGLWVEAGFKGRYDDEPRRGPVVYPEPFSFPNHPVVGVSWYEAIAFTRWLTFQINHATIPPKPWHIHLPNEPEWEKAARGGLRVLNQPLLASLAMLATLPITNLRQNDNPDKLRSCPWQGEAKPEYANYGYTQIGSTSAVGCFPQGKSAYGVEELSGNVWEWTRSLWDKIFLYPYNAIDGREQVSAGPDVRRVVRGGAYLNDVNFVRCAVRFGLDPGYRDNHVGFRVVASPLPLISENSGL